MLERLQSVLEKGWLLCLKIFLSEEDQNPYGYNLELKLQHIMYYILPEPEVYLMREWISGTLARLGGVLSQSPFVVENLPNF